MDTMDKSEYQFILKLLDSGYTFFFNSNPQMNEILEQKLPEIYNTDYQYLASLSNTVDTNVEQEQPINHYENLVKIDSKKVNKFIYSDSIL